MKKNKKVLYITIIIILLLIIGILSIVIINNNNKMVCKEQNKPKPVYKEKKEGLTDKDNVVLFGDSITELYPVDEVYNGLPVVRSGVSGYKTKNLLDRMEDMLYKYNPTKVFLLIGINDLYEDKSEEHQEETINNIKKIIKEIKSNRPKAAIYLESIYPVNTKMKENVEDDDNEMIKKVNEKLKDYCSKNSIKYIDMYNQLLDDNGDFSKDYTSDGLHPNTMGYARISRILSPYITE